MPSTKSFRFLSRVFVTGLVLLTSSAALARPEAPGELFDAAKMECVPLCTMCHSGNPGTKTNWDPVNKPLGGALVVPITNETDLKPAYDAWAMLNPADAAKVQKGIEPKSNVDVCGPTYGCGAHVAKQAPPSDFSAPLWVIGAMIAGGVLRRRKARASRD